MSNFNEEMTPVEKTYWDTFCNLKAGWLFQKSQVPFSGFHSIILGQYWTSPEVQSKVKLLGMCYRELTEGGKWQGNERME